MGPVRTGDWGLGLGLDNILFFVLTFRANFFIGGGGPRGSVGAMLFKASLYRFGFLNMKDFILSTTFEVQLSVHIRVVCLLFLYVIKSNQNVDCFRDN